MFGYDCAMAPVQPSMDTDIECKPHHSSIASFERESRSTLAQSGGITSRGMDNCEETLEQKVPLLNEETMVAKNAEDVQVDIITSTNVKETRTVGAEDPDATDYSSSFADTISDNERRSGLSEAEVESHFFGDGDLGYDAFNGLFETRKKKLTDHWRSFIRPLMWRCKWTELKIKEIQSQAFKYSRELEAYEQRKHLGTHQSTFEGFCSKSLPFSNQCYRRKAKKRRKRKRVEDTTDTASYMSCHGLFCYLENKRSNADSASVIDDFDNIGAATMNQHGNCNDNFGMDKDTLSFGFKDGDNSLEGVLWKIEILHSRVLKLKNQLDMVMSKNASKFSSSENLSLLAPYDAQTSSAPSPTLSAGNGETISVEPMFTVAQHVSGYDIGDLVLPEGAISSYGEAIHVPDIIESTVGLLSAADVTFHDAQIGDSCEDIVDNILIHHEAVDIDRHTFMDTSNKLIETHQEQGKGEEGESTNPCSMSTSETDIMTKTTMPHGQSTLNSCLASDFQIPRNKRKRGDRKAGSGSWSKKCSGEPDSQ